MQVSFYHLGAMPLIKSCAKLLEKVLSLNKRAVLWCGSQDRVSDLNEGLWTYAPRSFLPHGTAREGQPERHPIWVTSQLENPNDAEILLVVDGMMVAQEAPFQRCLDIFSGMDQTAVEAARTRWQTYHHRGDDLAYWKQNSAGVWEQPRKTECVDKR